MDDRDPDKAENSDANPFRRNVEQVGANGRAANENAVANYIYPKRHRGAPMETNDTQCNRVSPFGQCAGAQKETRRTGNLRTGNSYDDDVAGFQWLAQHFQNVAVELRQFVEEQHAVVRQRDFAGPRLGAATDQRDRTGRVVRCPERSHAPVAQIHSTLAQRGDRSHIPQSGLVPREFRKRWFIIPIHTEGTQSNGVR